MNMKQMTDVSWMCFMKSTVPFLPVGGWEGSSLLSGGRESVLVEWRDMTEKNKEFLPRLGATIEHISVSPAGDLFCTSHSDNSKSNLLVLRKHDLFAVMNELVLRARGIWIPKTWEWHKWGAFSVLSPPPFCSLIPLDFSIFRIAFMKIED